MQPARYTDLQGCIQSLGLPRSPNLDWNLLNLALTHPSASAIANYEQLEFMGDAVLRLAAAEFLTETYPQLAVGELSALRSQLVSDRLLATIAEAYTLDRYILKSSSAATDRAGITARQADALEALLAVLYLTTQDLQLVRTLLKPHFVELTAIIRKDPARQNYKAALQELTQARYQQLPKYRSSEVNPVHAAPDRFQAEVWFQGQCYGQGVGRSIKAAEQAAAQAAFTALQM
ncbi:MAG: ribonuclease III [Cyanobacteria bacterium P01_H01_bin.121]